MSTLNQLIARQLTMAGNTLLTAMDLLGNEEFFAENDNGFSAAWVTGHLAAVADLFSSWFDGRLLFGPSFHAIFNETGTAPEPASRAADADRFAKAFLLDAFRQAVIKALRALDGVKDSEWDSPAPPGAPVTMLTAGSVWEHLALHAPWHNGELAGSVPYLSGTYALNPMPHWLYVAQEGSS